MGLFSNEKKDPFENLDPNAMPRPTFKQKRMGYDPNDVDQWIDRAKEIINRLGGNAE